MKKNMMSNLQREKQNKKQFFTNLESFGEPGVRSFNCFKNLGMAEIKMPLVGNYE